MEPRNLSVLGMASGLIIDLGSFALGTGTKLHDRPESGLYIFGGLALVGIGALGLALNSERNRPAQALTAALMATGFYMMGAMSGNAEAFETTGRFVAGGVLATLGGLSFGSIQLPTRAE